MKLVLQRFSSAILTALGIVILIAAPAAAREGSSGGSGDSSSSGSPTTAASGSSTTTTHTESSSGGTHTSGSTSGETETGTSSATETETTETEIHKSAPLSIDDMRNQAKQELATERQGKQEHTAQQRQQSCTAHQQEINMRIADLGRNAKKHLATFDGIFQKVQDFQTKQQLSVSDYATLLAAAQSAQTNATTAVNALGSLSVTVDCTSSDPAASLATVKTAANNAKTALQNYRAAIKAIIVALQAAKPSDTTQNSNTSGSN